MSTSEHDTEQIGEDQRSGWARPPLAPFDRSTTDITFQTMDIDYVTGSPIAGMPGAQTGSVAVLRMFGVTEGGQSVLAHVHGFTPYFYVPAPNGFTQAHCGVFRKALGDALRNKVSDKNLQVPEYVLGVELVMRQSVYGFYGKAKAQFLQIFLALPKHTPAARGILENGLKIEPFGFREFQTFESNVPFALRFMADLGIQGASWATVPRGKYTVRVRAEHVSTAQLEVDVAYDQVVTHAPDGEWSKLAPFRVLSFDIECCGRKGFFPEPDKDPVIQIANIVKVQGESKPFVKNVFVVGSCSAIVGAHVLSFRTEKEMLLAWRQFWTTVDPDVIIGYNTANFDIPYLLDRASALGLSESFPYLGRALRSRSVVKSSTFSSAAYGTRESKTTAMEGRNQLDMLQVIQRDHKLTSYSLNAVSAHFLGEQKEDVHYSIISELHNGSPDDRRRLAVYCLKDAYLPLRLYENLMIIFNYVEMARVTGVPISYLLERGQQIKVLSQLFRVAIPAGLVIPTFRSQPSEEKYEGATVLEPKTGFYEKPIATLDFASLYPSIMRAHNLCYSTLVNPADVHKLKPEDYTRTPLGHVFVKPHVQMGLLPQILESLTTARKRAKDDLKKATDPTVRAVLDGRQLALKVSANSVYGFTGATVGQLPCLEISASVTSFGREMIDRTASLVAEHFSVANGYKHNATVIYGDTDSVMVLFGVDTVAEAMALGKEGADFVSKTFISPIKLEFEKVYFPYLLINKKRYAGMYWTKPDKPDKMDAKGIETVRRDNCQLVRTVIGTALNKILMDRDVAGAISYVKGVISDLLMNRLDLSMLVISKALSKDAEEYDSKQGHVELAEKMRKRDPLTAPAIGDRVPYVMIKGPKGAKGYEKAEDPIYVLDNNIPIDTQYYLEQQLSLPLLRIFEPIMPNPQSLLSGDHTRSIAIATPSASSGGIMRFAVKTNTCLGCKAVIPAKAPNQTLCPHCEDKEPEIYQVHLKKVNKLEAEFAEAWTCCQRCTQTFHAPVLCTSRDCPIFYKRVKIRKDLAEATATIGRFHDTNQEWF